MWSRAYYLAVFGNVCECKFVGLRYVIEQNASWHNFRSSFDIVSNYIYRGQSKSRNRAKYFPPMKSFLEGSILYPIIMLQEVLN